MAMRKWSPSSQARVSVVWKSPPFFKMYFQVERNWPSGQEASGSRANSSARRPMVRPASLKANPGQVLGRGRPEVLDQGAEADPAGQGRGTFRTERSGQPVAQGQDETQTLPGLVRRGPPGQGIVLVGLLVLVGRPEIGVQRPGEPPRAEAAGADDQLAPLGQPGPAFAEQEVEFGVPDGRQVGFCALAHGLLWIRLMTFATSAAREAPELPTEAMNAASDWALVMWT